MIITRTPLRISFVGGGSDLKEFYSNHRGSVISTSINKYIYLSMHKMFQNDSLFLKYSKSEYVKNASLIDHKIIKEVFLKYQISGVDFNSSSDIPSGTGLGSSSAFTAGLIKLCLYHLKQNKSNYWIAEEACKIEIDKLNEPIGKQDQFACAVGGLNQIFFNTDGTVDIHPINISTEKLMNLENNLYLFYTGNTRSASKILKVQKDNTTKEEKFNVLKKMVSMTDDLKNIIENGDINDFGELLNQGWEYKKELAKGITNKVVDDLYSFGIDSGANGGKLLGAGGGGFVLFYCKEENKKNFLTKMSEYYIPIEFSFDFEGSIIKSI